MTGDDWVTVGGGVFAVGIALLSIRRKMARRRALRRAPTDPAVRARLIVELRDELSHVLAASRNARGMAQLMSDVHARPIARVLARVLLDDDKPAEALALLSSKEGTDFPPTSDRPGWKPLFPDEAAVSLACLVRLGRWDDAVAALSAYGRSAEQNDPVGLIDTRALLALGQHRAAEALDLLNQRSASEPRLRLTRARALAELGRSDEEVWRLLEALPRVTLEGYAKSNPDEKAAHAARRILDRQGAYR